MQLSTAGRSGLAVACLTAVREVPGSNRAVGSCVYRTKKNNRGTHLLTQPLLGSCVYRTTTMKFVLIN